MIQNLVEYLPGELSLQQATSDNPNIDQEIPMVWTQGWICKRLYSIFQIQEKALYTMVKFCSNSIETIKNSNKNNDKKQLPGYLLLNCDTSCYLSIKQQHSYTTYCFII